MVGSHFYKYAFKKRWSSEMDQWAILSVKEKCSEILKFHLIILGDGERPKK